MGKIELDHTGSGGGITLSSDGTDLLVDGSAVGGGATNYTVTTKTASFTVTTSDLGKIFYVDPASSAVTASLPAAATAGSGFYVTFTLDNNEASYKTLTIDPDGSETICGLSTYKIKPGMTLTTYSDGSNWFSLEDSNHMISTNSYGSKVQADANGNRSLAIGDGAYSNNNYSTALGKGAQATGVNSIAIGATNAQVTADAASATAIGSNSGSGSSEAHGNGAMALNGSYSSGTNSLAAAIGDNSSSYGASGTAAIALGYQAKATQSYAFATGYQSQATGNSAISMGFQAQSNGGVALGYKGRASGTRAFGVNNNTSGGATNDYAIAIGDTALASGNSAIAIGIGSQADATRSVVIGSRGHAQGVSNRYAFSGSSIIGNNDGASQYGLFVLMSDTTDATAEALTTNNSTPSATNQIILPNNSAYAFHGTIVARESATDGTECAAWKIEGLIRREANAGTTTLVNSATTIIDNSYSWGMALSADTTNGGLKIEVTGVASTNIRWLATIHTSELIYA